MIFYLFSLAALQMAQVHARAAAAWADEARYWAIQSEAGFVEMAVTLDYMAEAAAEAAQARARS